MVMSRNLVNAVQQEQSQRLERIERGKQANMAASFILEPILESQQKVLQKMISAYRAGKADHGTLLGGIAEMTALDNLITELNNAQTQGEAALKQEFGNG